MRASRSSLSDVLRARTIILACGVAWRRLSIEGFDRLEIKRLDADAKP